MVVHTLPTITGPVTASPITTNPSLTAKWILFTSVGGASVVAGVGDAVDATDGAKLVNNVPVMYPQNHTDATDVYQLSQMQAFVPAATTLTITYGS